MYILFTLFLISLTSITVLIGRKLMVLRSGEMLIVEEINMDSPILNQVKTVTVRSAKKLGYVGLVATIRLYFRSRNLVKAGYETTKVKVKEISKKYIKTSTAPKEPAETSKFLRTMSEYKHKIRALKHRIKEEEEGL